MQHKTFWKKLVSVALLGAFAAIPVVGISGTAQADPPRHAPAWGQRAKQDKRFKKHKKEWRRSEHRKHKKYDKKKRHDWRDKKHHDNDWNRYERRDRRSSSTTHRR